MTCAPQPYLTNTAGEEALTPPHYHFLYPQIQVPAKVKTPDAEGTINLDGYMQHAVIACKDLDDEVEFWTKGVGMRVLRSRWDLFRRARSFVGLGSGQKASSALACCVTLWWALQPSSLHRALRLERWKAFAIF